ncbi:expressed unknown protein [Seminavis robusta]|uniref:Cyclic nucleotide-binding domain-containing protein n=1 Tax=Seminavis robusta TaxID=568900 RepID=A0A9N8HL18_9STRA|nr:expressed unknown protein [Seminavis robusta]|eukprot:Sro880_g215050.1 n/a (473) ;mRNA; r:24869-26287
MPRRGPSLQKLLSRRQLNEQQLEKVASALLEGSKSSTRPRYVKGTHNGRFFRIKLHPEPTHSKPSHLPQLPPSGGPFPHGFKTVLHNTKPHSAPNNKNQKAESVVEDYWQFVKEWMKENWPTVVLNMGSVATLIGFTRSDVLELRMLSVTGSTANVIYNFTLSPTRYLPVCWSALFATVNGFKIREILQERHSEVHMTPEQEDTYIQFFLPHGITPRQYQVLEESAEQVVVPKGSAIIRQGDEMDYVCLVVSGSTRASISGRRLTAASAVSPSSLEEEKAGGNSGAWIGEMAFLETYWTKEQQRKRINNTKNPSTKNDAAETDKSAENVDEPTKAKEATANATNDTATTKPPPPPESKPKVSNKPVNRYTIVAVEDCLVWRWKFEQVEAMMSKSTDFRAALSRAMTSAIVSKVINFTVGKSTALPTWSTWLDDWRYNAGARVNVKTEELAPPEQDKPSETENKVEAAIASST